MDKWHENLENKSLKGGNLVIENQIW